MIKCKLAECGKFEGCCNLCPDTTCNDRCDMQYTTCEKAETNGEETGLTAFEATHIQLLQEIVNTVQAKKKLEAREKLMKDQLKEAMEQYGVKKFESELLDITYVAATSASSIDTAKLKKLHPEIAAQCTKVSPKSAYIKVTVK